MHISKISNEDGSFEIYFEKLNYWEEFDLIVDFLEKENDCEIIKRQDAIYSKSCDMKKENILFKIKHDDMLGNYIYASNATDAEVLKELAQNVINSIQSKLDEVKKQ